MNVRSLRNSFRFRGLLFLVGICGPFALHLDSESFFGHDAKPSASVAEKASAKAFLGGTPTSLSNVARAVSSEEDLKGKAVSLDFAEEHVNGAFLRSDLSEKEFADGRTVKFCPEMILVKFAGSDSVKALRVERNREVEAVRKIGEREDVEFAELNVLQERQFSPDDPQVGSQWHHVTLDSRSAWNQGLGSDAVRIAIVDTPFQMNHPDLASNVVAGWSVVSNAVVSSSEGIDHSTLGAGLTAAVVNNGVGIAGMVNCKVLPVHINGFTSEMYDAVIWCADHGVRVVNLSWSGADSPTLNDAGLYLKEHAQGILAMSGVNGSVQLNYPNHPNIYCISMTDEADNQRSASGAHIDFAAPGFAVLSTTTNSGYAFATGTSFSTPIFCGVVAGIFSLNPTLSAEEAIEILMSTADDKGEPGWDPFFGWGLINYGRAMNAAAETLPRISSVSKSGFNLQVTTDYREGVEYALWRNDGLESSTWSRVTGALTNLVSSTLSLTDPNATQPKGFYRVGVSKP